MNHVYAAVERMTCLEPYDRPPVHGGTCWRVLGPHLDDEHKAIAIGVEAFLDKKRRRVCLATFFEVQ
jgi:hypothetical protein